MIPGSANPLLLASAAGSPAPSYQIERSLRFNSSDSAYLSRTPAASSTNRSASTYAFWMKLAGKDSTGTQASNMVLSCYDGSSTYALYWSFLRDSNGRRLEMSLGGASNFGVTYSPSFRDPSAWYHIVITIDTANAVSTDRIRLYVNRTRVTDTLSASWPTQNYQPTTFIAGRNTNIGVDFTTSYANYFNGYLADIHFIDGQALDPTSFGEFDANGVWQPKAYTGTYGTNGFHLPFSDNSTAAALGTDTSGNGNTWTVNNISVSPDQNYVTAISVTGASIDNAYGPVINGFDNNVATFFRTTGGAPGSPVTLIFAPQQPIAITTSLVFRGYIGSNQGYAVQIGSTTLATGANDPSNNTDWTVPGAAGLTLSTTTPLKLIANNNSVGGEGVWWNYLSVDGSQLIFSASSIGANDSLVDTPTNYGTDTGAGGEVRGNYATLNPLHTVSTGGTFSNGNLDFTAYNRSAASTIAVSSGKWYFEGVMTATSGPGDGSGFGIYNTAGQVGYIRNETTPNFTSTIPGVSSISPFGSNFTTGDLIGVAFDADAGTLQFTKNGSGYGALITGIPGGVWYLFSNTRSSFTLSALTVNFGQRPFAYPAPSGFKALCTTNLASTTITTSGSYTGNGVADGPFVYLNGVPTAMTVNGNAVTFGTEADRLSNGFKVRTTSTTYNQNAVVYNYSITSTGDPFKRARAQSNP